jgi:hypothetical protein
MKPHHILVQIFPAAITAVLAIWLAAEHQARLRLAGEHQALEQEWQQMADLAARNEQLSNQLAQASSPKPLPPDELMELLRLRGEVGVLLRQQPDRDLAREENRQIHAALAKYLETMNETNAQATADYWPQNSWTNHGYGSPEAGLQTLLWAGSNGDLTNFAASFDTDARTNLDNEFKGQSAADAAVRLADETYGLKSIQILSRQILDNNTVLLTVEMEKQDDFQTVQMVMKRNGDGWKFAGPPQ